jgi:hypothetical protein
MAPQTDWRTWMVIALILVVIYGLLGWMMLLAFRDSYSSLHHIYYLLHPWFAEHRVVTTILKLVLAALLYMILYAMLSPSGEQVWLVPIYALFIVMFYRDHDPIGYVVVLALFIMAGAERVRRKTG